jgi:hypothetical protein
MNTANVRSSQALLAQLSKRLERLPFEHKALQLSTAHFGDDFDLDEWKRSYYSFNPEEMNRVRQVTGGFNEILNHCTEIARVSVTAAGLLPADRRPHAPTDYKAFQKSGGITAQRCSILIELNRVRNELTHIYVEVEAETVHRSVKVIITQLPGFTKGVVKWLRNQGLIDPN